MAVSEDEITKDHTYREVEQMHLAGAEFYIVEEDYSDLPEVKDDFDFWDGSPEDSDKECGLPFVEPDDSKKHDEKENSMIIPSVSDQLSSMALEADEEPEEPKKKPVDKGKIKALYESGKTISWIADEMGLSWATISYHLKSMGLK